MRLEILNLISVIFLADETLAKEKATFENIDLIVVTLVGIATIAGVIIAYLTYRADKEKEKQTKKKKNITAGNNARQMPRE